MAIKVTIRVDEQVWDDFKNRCANEGKPATAGLDDLLRGYLAGTVATAAPGDDVLSEIRQHLAEIKDSIKPKPKFPPPRPVGYFTREGESLTEIEALTHEAGAGRFYGNPENARADMASKGAGSPYQWLILHGWTVDLETKRWSRPEGSPEGNPSYSKISPPPGYYDDNLGDGHSIRRDALEAQMAGKPVGAYQYVDRRGASWTIGGNSGLR